MIAFVCKMMMKMTIDLKFFFSFQETAKVYMYLQHRVKDATTWKAETR